MKAPSWWPVAMMVAGMLAEACSDPHGYVRVTVIGPVMSVAELRVGVRYGTKWATGHSFPVSRGALDAAGETFLLVFDPDVAGDIDIDVDAFDGAHHPIRHGGGKATVRPGTVQDASVPLPEEMTHSDGGDGAAADRVDTGEVADSTLPADLSMSMPAIDMAPEDASGGDAKAPQDAIGSEAGSDAGSGPILLSVSPGKGPAKSNSLKITLTGDHFVPVPDGGTGDAWTTRVLFGDTEASNVRVMSEKTIFVDLPDGMVGTKVPVRVTNPDGRYAEWKSFSYYAGQLKLDFTTFSASYGLVATPLFDVDGDGLLDLVVVIGDTMKPTIEVHLNDGQGGFKSAVASNSLAPCDPVWVQSAELNGDQRTDLVFTCSDHHQVAFALRGKDVPDAGQNLSFTPLKEFDVGDVANGFQAFAADLDGDGAVDIAVPNSTGAGTLHLLFADPNDPLHYSMANTVVSPDFLAVPGVIAIGHLQHDNSKLPDIAAGTPTEPKVRALLNQGKRKYSGTLSNLTGTDAYNNAYWVAIGDVNGDGWDDVVVTHVPNHVSVKWQDKMNANVFQNKLYTLPGYGMAALADFNVDGVSEIAVAAPAGVNLLVAYGDNELEQNVFMYPGNLVINGGARVATGDLDNDKRTDVVVWGAGKILIGHNISQ